MPEPSVLIYARYFNLTQDHTLHDPLTALNTTILAQPKEPTILQNLDASVEDLVKGFEKTARDYVSLANDDPLSISQEVASYLKSCTNHTIPDMSQVYDKLLPDLYRIRKLKIDLPLLLLGGGDVERDVRKIKRGMDLQMVIDDFLDESDEEGSHRRKYEPPTSSAVSAEILEWSKTLHEATVKKEKLDVNMETMKYIREALSTSIEPADMSKTMMDITPKIVRPDSPDVCSITEDEFEVEIETDVSDLPNILEPNEYTNGELPASIKRELEMLGRSDAAVDEEYFLQNTQADREMDDLFRQFTYHDADDQDRVVVNEVKNGLIEKLPASKRRKLVHETRSEVMPQNIGGKDIQDLKMRLEDLKFKVSDLPSHLPFSLPALDLSIVSSQGDKNDIPERKPLDPGLPPLRIPTIHEALRESMPVPTKVAQKSIVEEKAVISSDLLLWKEPGLRVLDQADDDDDHIVPDNYPIEEWKSDTFVSVQPDIIKRSTAAYFFGKLDHAEDADRTGHNLKEQEAKTNSTMIKPEPVDNVHMKQEFRPTDAEELVPVSVPIHFNPFARVEAGVLTQPNGVSGKIAEHRVSESIGRVQKPSGSPKLSDKSTDRKPTIQSCEVGLRSLLPEAKRKQAVQRMELTTESDLNDSLSSFLNLRGKKFKPPSDKRLCRAAEVIDDPIVSTQYSPADEWFSDELTLIPSPIRPVESVQQELMPPITPLEEPRTIVINSTLLQTKPLLIQFLESPESTNLTLIYRDLDVKQCRGPDLILNTTTSLFITNLQTLSQRPLPGQKSATGLSSAHDMVADLACSYSQIIALVHHTTSTESAAQSKILLTQASFASFCQSFMRSPAHDGRQVQPYWLPCVNLASISDIVNAWVWQVINRCAYRNGSPKSPRPGCLAHSILIQEETLWELFLCKAGLNPLAAQVMISSLKRSSVQSSTGANQEAVWGLRRLVAMDSQERTKIFGKMIGRDVVERLNRVFSDRDESEYRM